MDGRSIESYARRLRLGVIVAFGLTVLLVAFGHFGLRFAGAPVLLQSRSGLGANLLGIGDMVLLLTGVAIYWLTEALRAVAAGKFFSRVVVRRFRLFALWMLIAALFNSLAPMVLATMSRSSPHHHRLMVIIDLRDLLLVALTLLMLLIARMFEQARAIEDEMNEIV